MKNFIARLSSRKFLLTVAGLVLVTLYPDQQQAVVGLIIAFIGAEGVADTVGRYAEQGTAQEIVKKDTAKIETLGVDPDAASSVNTNMFTAGDSGDLPM